MDVARRIYVDHLSKFSLYKLIVLLGLLLFTSEVVSEITIDGRIDEKEWLLAQRFVDFKKTEPDTGEYPEYNTQAFMFSDNEGIYIAFKNQQPIAERRSPYNRKDKDTRADYNKVVIDITGQGDSAYVFVVTAAAGTLDGIYVNGDQLSYDWDGVWYFAVHEDDDYWYSEIFIPWYTATYQPPTEDRVHHLKVWFNRKVVVHDTEYSYPYTHDGRDNFVRELQSITTTKSKSEFQWNAIPQLTTTYDNKSNEVDTNIGVDLFLKPTPNQIISATINPDFGAVESDELISNFTPIETLVSEKRSFFTENHSVFDIKDDQYFVALNTRRIGASTDSDNPVVPGISNALKYINIGSTTQFGLLYANEKDEDAVQGKSFYAMRAKKLSENWSIGNLSTYTKRPELSRSVMTSIADIGYWNSNLDVSLFLLHSNAEQDAAVSERREQGYGAIVELNYLLNRNWNQYIKLTSLNSELSLNDLGYLERNSIEQVQWYQDYSIYFDNTLLRSISLSVGTELSANKRDEKLADYYELNTKITFFDASFTELEFTKTELGIDDLITFGNGSVILPGKKKFYISYSSPQKRRFQYLLAYSHFQEGLGGWANQWELQVQYDLFDNFSINLNALAINSDDWLIGGEEGGLEQYSRLYREIDIEFLLFLANAHEISLRLQSNALEATAIKSYRTEYLSLMQVSQEPTDFALSDAALQLRYFYRFSPNSEFYLSLIRNGSFFTINRNEFVFNNLFDKSITDPYENILVAKLKWSF